VREVAEGMSHLHNYNIIHRDLAARNILLSNSNIDDGCLKVSDFGMSRVLQQDIEYKTKSGVGPVCWMAPESINQRIFSKKSDVWMFGVLVYEIAARREPHTDKSRLTISLEIGENFLTPTIPNDCPPKLRQLMEMCWNKQPDQRPNFQMICKILEQ